MFLNQFWPKFLEFYEFCEKFRKFFENFEKKSIFLALIKLQLPKKWPKNAIKMKISGVDKAPKNSRPPQISLIVSINVKGVHKFHDCSRSQINIRLHQIHFLYPFCIQILRLVYYMTSGIFWDLENLEIWHYLCNLENNAMDKMVKSFLNFLDLIANQLKVRPYLVVENLLQEQTK